MAFINLVFMFSKNKNIKKKQYNYETHKDI